jgi:hypothetical protein
MPGRGPLVVLGMSLELVKVGPLAALFAASVIAIAIDG